MRNTHGWSVVKISGIVTSLLIILIVLNIIVVSLISFIGHSITAMDVQASEYFRYFNRYILSVNNDGEHVSPGVISAYDELHNYFQELNKNLKKSAEPKAPDYNIQEEKEFYSASLIESAAEVRSNLSERVDLSYKVIESMIIISIIVSLSLMILMLLGRYAIIYYQQQMLDGLEYMEKVHAFEIRPDYQKRESRIKEVTKLNRAIYNMSNDIIYNRKLIETGFHGNLDLLMGDMFENFRKRMPCDRVALAFVDLSGTCTAETAVCSYNNPYLIPGFREPIASTSLGKVIETAEPRIIDDLSAYAESHSVSAATSLILKEGIQSSITMPMMFEDKCLGFFFVSSREKNAYDKKDMNYTMRVINLLKQKFYIEYLMQEIISEISNAFVALMEEKDNETSAHIVRMSQYSYITARAYHEHIKPLQPRFMRETLWYAPLHDIGKVGIPDSILLKDGPLSHDEMEQMKDHVISGTRVLERMNERLIGIVSTPLMRTAVEIISGHHEKFDGSGYPEGLKGQEIPLAGRIVAIADVFDALTSKRPYKAAFSVEKAIEIMKDDMNGSFDPDVMEAFKYGLPEIRTVYEKFKEV